MILFFEETICEPKYLLDNRNTARQRDDVKKKDNLLDESIWISLLDYLLSEHWCPQIYTSECRP